ncbi:hypothetical protein BJ741DRAFT_589695 [Chytriomyces cf. hyalinus JEL632]|nr:hypothetical protein BJ741DRAFT_589695 [Chytriomyces cf. hyalinus JEL632]
MSSPRPTAIPTTPSPSAVKNAATDKTAHTQSDPLFKYEASTVRDSQTTMVGQDSTDNLQPALNISEGTVDVEPVAVKRIPKKVNFWGWVDVGFSHSVDEYDRKPLCVDPLTKDGAIEVMEMRIAMKRVSDGMYKWRSDYENNFPPIDESPSKLGLDPKCMSATVLSTISESDELKISPRVQRPEFIVGARRDSISTRFQQMSVQKNRGTGRQNTGSHAEPRKPVPTQFTFSSWGMDRNPANANARNASVASSSSVHGGPSKAGKQSFDAVSTGSKPVRKWAWNDHSASKASKDSSATSASSKVGHWPGTTAAFSGKGKKY